MTNTQIANILDYHGIPFYMVGESIIAEDSYTMNGEPFTELANLTGVSKAALLDWLGY